MDNTLYRTHADWCVACDCGAYDGKPGRVHERHRPACARTGEHRDDCDDRCECNAQAVSAPAKCDTHRCELQAVNVAHWPGQTKQFCEACTRRARGVASAMGFELSTSPVVTR